MEGDYLAELIISEVLLLESRSNSPGNQITCGDRLLDDSILRKDTL